MELIGFYVRQSQKDAYFIAMLLGDKNSVVLRGFYIASFLRLLRNRRQSVFSTVGILIKSIF